MEFYHRVFFTSTFIFIKKYVVRIIVDEVKMGASVELKLRGTSVGLRNPQHYLPLSVISSTEGPYSLIGFKVLYYVAVE